MTNVKVPKKLHRSQGDRVVSGVCGGLGDYFSIDPIIFRIFFILLIFSHGIGVLLYIFLWVIVPEEADLDEKENKNDSKEDNGKVENNRKYILGTFLVLLGVGALIFKFLSISLSFDLVWPIVLIFAGGYLIFK